MEEQQPTTPVNAPQEPAAQSPQAPEKSSGKASFGKTVAYYLVAGIVIYFLIWFLWLRLR